MARLGWSYPVNLVSFPYHYWYAFPSPGQIESWEPIPTQRYQIAVAVPMGARC